MVSKDLTTVVAKLIVIITTKVVWAKITIIKISVFSTKEHTVSIVLVSDLPLVNVIVRVADTKMILKVWVAELVETAFFKISADLGTFVAKAD